MFPVLDLASPHRDALARELDRVCREIGFVAVTNHGVPRSVVDGAWRAATQFFLLPPSEKAFVAMPHSGYPYGYSGLNEEDLERSRTDHDHTSADFKESLSIGPPGSWGAEPASRQAMHRDTPTRWPRRPRSLRVSWSEYYHAMESICAKLMRLAARALSLPEEFFAPAFDCHMSAFRALSYPSTPSTASPARVRAGAHTDFGAITVLYPQPGSSGLQILRRDRWVDVPAVEGNFVVNVGDLLARWTNDRWVSTMHRVIDASPEISESRQSLAFFYNPNDDARIECLPSCLGPGESPRYPPVRAGTHLMQKYRRSVDLA